MAIVGIPESVFDVFKLVTLHLDLFYLVRLVFYLVLISVELSQSGFVSSVHLKGASVRFIVLLAIYISGVVAFQPTSTTSLSSSPSSTLALDRTNRASLFQINMPKSNRSPRVELTSLLVLDVYSNSRILSSAMIQTARKATRSSQGLLLLKSSSWSSHSK